MSTRVLTNSRTPAEEMRMGFQEVVMSISTGGS
jgi:hypothetical protein